MSEPFFKILVGLFDFCIFFFFFVECYIKLRGIFNDKFIPGEEQLWYNLTHSSSGIKKFLISQGYLSKCKRNSTVGDRTHIPRYRGQVCLPLYHKGSIVFNFLIHICTCLNLAAVGGYKIHRLHLYRGVILVPMNVCPIGWGCRIHRLHLCRGTRHPHQ